MNQRTRQQSQVAFGLALAGIASIATGRLANIRRSRQTDDE